MASVLSFSGQISWQIHSPCVCGIKGGVAQLTKALSNEWAGNQSTQNSDFFTLEDHSFYYKDKFGIEEQELTE